jgi:hypothetical protein
VRRFACLAALVTLLGCGGVGTTHYSVRAALDCVQRTDSTKLERLPRRIAVAFTSPDGVSAVESVVVAFAPLSASGVAGGVAHGLAIPKPDWTERHDDAEVCGKGPYEPPIARRRRIPDAQAKSAATTLDAHVREAVDVCRTRNER